MIRNVVRALILFALGSFGAAHAGAFVMTQPGRGQANTDPLQTVDIQLVNSNDILVLQTRYFYNPNELTFVSRQNNSNFLCEFAGTGAIDIIGQQGQSGVCRLTFRAREVSFPRDSFIDGVITGCAVFPFPPGSCSIGDAFFQIIGPAINLSPSGTISLSSSVGLPAPTQVVRVTNTGISGSLLNVTSSTSGSPASVSPLGSAGALPVGAFRDYTLSCSTATAGSFSRVVSFAHNATPNQTNPANIGLVCTIRTPPNLTYAPTTGTPVVIPGTVASTRTADIDVTLSGGSAGGARTLSCSVPANYAVTVETSPFVTGSAPGRIRLGCNSVAQPGPGTLSCTESGNPSTQRTWPISCNSDEIFTATPSFDTPVVLAGNVGGPNVTHQFTVTNTGTEGTTLSITNRTGLSGPLSITPNTGSQSILQGSAGVPYTVTCSSLASTFPGVTQTLGLVHNAPGSPSTLSVTCNMRTPPTLAYAPSFGNSIQVSASPGGATTTTNIAVSTTGGDAGGTRAISCSAPNYLVQVDNSPFGVGGTGMIRLGCDSITQPTSTLSCTESPGGAVRQWLLTCQNTAVYSSTPRPSSAIGVYSAIGETGFVDADVAVRNLGTAQLNIGINGAPACTQTPSGLGFGVSILPNPVPGNGTATLNVTCPVPPIGTAVFTNLSCGTNDPTRPSIVYKLVCVAPPMTDPGEGASPEERLTSPTPDGGALLGSTTIVAEGPNGEELVVIGAPNGGGDGDGRVYVFVRQRGAGAGGLADAKRGGNGLGKPVAVLKAPANRGKAHAKGIGNKFGDAIAVSPDGTMIAVGASTGGGSNTGQVLVFEMPPGGWDDLEGLTPMAVDPPADPGVVATDFGAHVEFSPDGMLVVGAPGSIVSSVDDAGAAFVFDTNLQQVGAPITSAAPETGAAFGTSLDVGTGMLAIGAPGENNSTGSAYFYEIDAGVVGPANVQSAPGGSFGDKWGSQVAIAGNAIIVGAPNDDTAAGADSGSATVLLAGDGNSVTPIVTLVPPPGGGTQGAGAAVGTNGDVIVLGAPFSDVNGDLQRGRALVYDLESAVTSGVATPAGVYENTIGEAGDEFGSAVGISRGRLLLGAPLSDEGPDVDEGRVDPYDLDRIFRGNYEF